MLSVVEVRGFVGQQTGTRVALILVVLPVSSVVLRVVAR